MSAPGRAWARMPSGLSSAPMAAPATAQAFEQLAAPLRRGLGLHCYLMLGSLHEAEDLVQETLLRAWRSFERFDGRAFRAWLYRIATHACLDALERRAQAQRLLPDQLGPASTSLQPGAPAAEVAWLEPYPDARLEEVADGALTPEGRTAAREAVRLAFVAALQALPPRQRAALMLCEVLGWTAAEAAELLESSTASVTSALQRARETMARGRAPGSPPAAPAQARLLERYLRAWESHDAEGLAALLKEDATVVMPFWREWYRGRDTIRAFFAAQWRTCGGLELVPVGASGQPGFGVYQRGPAGRFEAHSLQVLTVEGEAVSSLAVFVVPGMLADFGLPAFR